MDAEARIEQVRNHLEIAYNHDKFSIDETKNTEDEVVVEVDMMFQDESRSKTFNFNDSGDIVRVRDTDRVV